MKLLQERWTSVPASEVVNQLTSQAHVSSPFGVTEAGLTDLRGFQFPSPISLKDIELAGVDFSYANLSKLLAINCCISDSNFSNAKVTVLANSTSIKRCTFSDANLSSSGSTGDALFSDCVFDGTDFRGAIFKSGVFSNCDFTSSKLNGVDFGNTKFIGCSFSGKIKKCFFRGEIENCNFLSVQLLDCAFYGAELKECIFPDSIILVSNWLKFVALVEGQLRHRLVSEAAKSFIKIRFSALSSVGINIKNQVIDLRDIEKALGNADIAMEIFSLFGACNEP